MALLLDRCRVNQDQLIHFCTRLNQAVILPLKQHVFQFIGVSLDEQLNMIVNVNMLQELPTSLNSTLQPVFVAVDAGLLKRPYQVTEEDRLYQIHEQLKKFRDIILNTDSRHPDETVLVNINMNSNPTLMLLHPVLVTGWLLEYPTVYTFTSIEGSSENCLGGERLVLVQVFATPNEGRSFGEHLVTSFSFPMRVFLNASLKQAALIEQLKKRFETRMSRQRFWRNWRLQTSTVTLERVIL